MPRQHTAHGLWLPSWQLCVRKSSPVPLPIRTRAAAHRHAGDLANVPCFYGLVETPRVAEHFLYRASTRTRLVAAWQLCVRKSSPVPLLIPTRAAAHRHAGDLANVPSSHGLVENARGGEHILRRHQHIQTVCGCLQPILSTIPILQPRRTSMLVTWPTSHALTFSSNVRRHAQGTLNMS